MPFQGGVIDCDQLVTSASEAKIRFSKVAGMLVQIAGLLYIPTETDGVPLRTIVSTLYTLLCDRLHLLDRFQECLTKVKPLLPSVQLNEAETKGDEKEVVVAEVCSAGKEPLDGQPTVDGELVQEDI